MSARTLTDRALKIAVCWLLKHTRQRGVMIFSIGPGGQWTSEMGGKDDGGLKTIENLHTQLLQGIETGSIKPPVKA